MYNNLSNKPQSNRMNKNIFYGIGVLSLSAGAYAVYAAGVVDEIKKRKTDAWDHWIALGLKSMAAVGVLVGGIYGGLLIKNRMSNKA